MKASAFFAHLRESRRSGFKLKLIFNSYHLWLNKTDYVHRTSLIYQSPSMSFWNPIEVVFKHLNPQKSKPWQDWIGAAHDLGLSTKIRDQIRWASCEMGDEELRDVLLKATMVKDIPIKDRTVHHIEGR